MKIIDISLPLSEELPTWPGDPPIQLEQISKIAEGEDANLTHLSMTLHAGTHVDAPVHFLEGGSTVDQLPLDLLVGPVLVIELSTTQSITSQDLEQASISAACKRLLIKTRNSEHWAKGEMSFDEDFIALGPDAASYLVERGIRVVGIDYLSIAPFHDPAPTHKILLNAGVLIVESLDLSGVDPGDYELMCLPIKIRGAEGAPARVFLYHQDRA